MKTSYLLILVASTSFIFGYFFAIHADAETGHFTAVQALPSMDKQLNKDTELKLNCAVTENKEQHSTLQKLLTEKELELQANKQALSAMATVSNRYNVMMEALNRQGFFRGPRIQENFEANDMFFKFFQLSPQKIQRVREITQNTLLSIQDWEVLNAYLLNKNEKRITYEIPPAMEEMAMIKDGFIDDLVSVIGEENRNVTLSFVTSLFEPFAFRRVITMDTLRTHDPSIAARGIKLRVKMFDDSGKRRRSASNITKEIPKRFSHLYHAY